MDPLTEALAKITAAGSARASLRNRIAADTRCRFLVHTLDALRGGAPRAGNKGRDDAFASAIGHARYRIARVKRLILARHAQLSGASAKTLLMEAAVYRRDEPPVLTIVKDETAFGTVAIVVSDPNISPAFKAALAGDAGILEAAE